MKKELLGQKKQLNELTLNKSVSVGSGVVSIGNGEQLEHPDRYTGHTGMEVFDVIDEFGLDYYAGNVVKYVIRHDKKGGLSSLEKARVYLDKMMKKYY